MEKGPYFTRKSHFNPSDAALTVENPLKMCHLQLSTAVFIIFKVICKMCILQNHFLESGILFICIQHRNYNF